MSHKLDLLLVNPGDQAEVYQHLAGGLSAIEAPTWVGLLATFARQNGLSVQLVDAEAEGLTPAQVGERVRDEAPRLAAVWVFGSQPSASTQKMTAASRTVAAIRELAPEARTILGGVHVSALPRKTLEEEAVDFVCEGEGAYTLLELVKLLREDDLEALGMVPGLWYREGGGAEGEIRSTPAGPLIEDLDQHLGAVAWDLLPVERYRAHNWHCFGHVDQRQPYGVIYTTLGCPFKCSFCCINAPFGGPSYRFRSPEKVLDEIGLLVERYGIHNIKFLDEMFVLNHKHVKAVCEGIIARGYEVNIWAYARVDTVKEGYLPLLKQAGFNWLALGIESASAYVRDGVDKDFKKADIYKVVRAIQAEGIHVIGNYIFGLPDDTHESMRETLEMAKELKCEMGNFYSAMAYPGSKLYPMALEEGWALPGEWHGYSQHARETLPLPTRALRAGEVLKFRDDAFHEYFRYGPYLDRVEKRFGAATRAHVVEMSQRRLERLHYDA